MTLKKLLQQLEEHIKEGFKVEVFDLEINDKINYFNLELLGRKVFTYEVALWKKEITLYLDRKEAQDND